MTRFGGSENGACGLAILGFPCNQFGLQEPGETPQEIVNGIKYVRPGNGFEPAFELFEKGDVNGAKQNQMYTFLKGHCPLPGGVIMKNPKDITWKPVRNNDLAWNFAKFLIDDRGKPVRRFLSSVSPQEISGDIERLILKCTARKRSLDWPQLQDDIDELYGEY